MTDTRKLLELAAKAMGYEHTKDNTRSDLWFLLDGKHVSETQRHYIVWAPHTDDGDSARMRSALGIGVEWIGSGGFTDLIGVECWGWERGKHVRYFADHNNDRDAALRMCALRVAAGIGRGMK